LSHSTSPLISLIKKTTYFPGGRKKKYFTNINYLNTLFTIFAISANHHTAIYLILNEIFYK
jgi:hypothetical protein